MIPSSRAALRAVQDSYDFEILMDVYHANGLGLDRKYANVPLTDFTLNHDDAAEVQGSSEGGFAWSDTMGRSIAPRKFGEVFSPTSTWLAYRFVIDLEGELESYRLAFHNITSISDPSTSWETVNDENIVSSQIFTFNASDAFIKTKRERLLVPTQAQDRSSTWAELGRLVAWPVDPVGGDREVPAGMTYDQDRLKAVYDLGRTIGTVPFMSPAGTLSGRPILTPNTWTFDLRPVTIDAKSDIWNADLVYNGVFVRAYNGTIEEGVTPEVREGDEGEFGATLLGSAVINSGALRWGRPVEGAFGMIPYFASSPLITTADQANAYAREQLKKVSQQQAVGASVTIVPNPFLQLGDPVWFPLDGKATRGRIMKISWRNMTSMVLEVLCDQ